MGAKSFLGLSEVACPKEKNPNCSNMRGKWTSFRCSSETVAKERKKESATIPKNG